MERFWKQPYGPRFAVGIEDTFVPQTPTGRRAPNEYELTGHYERWREDLELAAATGAGVIGYGIPWYRVKLIREFHARHDIPTFWTETSLSGTVGDRLGWLGDSAGLVRRLRDEGPPFVGYTWWPLFSLVDRDYRETDKLVEDHPRYMGMYDLEPEGTGGFRREETPVVAAFRAATREKLGKDRVWTKSVW